MMQNRPWAIGIDIGGTKIEIANVDQMGTIRQKISFPTKFKNDPEAIIDEIFNKINLVWSPEGPKPIGIGVGIAGQVDSEKGWVHFAPNLEWRNVPLGESLKEKLKAPVVVTNDVRASTWGEWLHGAGVDCNNFVCLFIGTGIGGGIVSGGRLISGNSNAAGELGHMIIEQNGPTCSCGNKGCLEALASGWAIAKQAESALKSQPELRRHWELKGPITARQVIQFYRNGEPIAQKIIELTRDALITAGINIVHILNPEKIILGGGVVQGLPEIRDWMQFGIKKKALSAASNIQILPALLGSSSGSIGAAALAMKLFKR